MYREGHMLGTLLEVPTVSSDRHVILFHVSDEPRWKNPGYHSTNSGSTADCSPPPPQQKSFLCEPCYYVTLIIPSGILILW